MLGNWGKPLFIAAVVTAAMGQAKQQKPPDALWRAREAYNDARYAEAIASATDALKQPALANGAALVLGRAYLERYHQTLAQADLEEGRKALQSVVPDKLSPRDRVEFQVGLGVSLYHDNCNGCFSAAAEMFAVALGSAEGAGDRDRVFEWWAGALEQLAQQIASENDRVAVYRRILDASAAEVAKHDKAVSASYWLVVGAAGAKDLDRAWGAAIAAWIRARGLGARGETLRADLDRFVQQALLPERAKAASPDDAQGQLPALVAQWEEIKKKYPSGATSASS